MATFNKRQAHRSKTLCGIVETVKPIIFGEGMKFFRVTIAGKRYDTTAEVDPGDFITFNLMPDLFYYPEQPEVPVISVLSFTNRLHNA